MFEKDRITKVKLDKIAYTGVVEDNQDPMRLQRVRIRVPGIHGDIPTQDLPWVSRWIDGYLGGVDGDADIDVPPVNAKVVVFYFDKNEEDGVYKGSIITEPHSENIDVDQFKKTKTRKSVVLESADSVTTIAGSVIRDITNVYDVDADNYSVNSNGVKIQGNGDVIGNEFYTKAGVPLGDHIHVSHYIDAGSNLYSNTGFPGVGTPEPGSARLPGGSVPSSSAPETVEVTIPNIPEVDIPEVE